MRSSWHISFFVAILLLSTGMSFVGYRYLLLASAYRHANFEHFSEVYSAIDLLRERPFPQEEDVQRLVQHVEKANEQSIWCVRNLSRVDRMVLEGLGASGALSLCAEATAAGLSTIRLLQAFSDEDQPAVDRFQNHNDTMLNLETLRDKSVAFEPYVAQIEGHIRRLVRTGTGGLSVLLLLLLAVVARSLDQANRQVQARSITDHLTSLLDRRGLDEALAQRSDPVVIIRIDLDRFKQVNDVLGHKAGDFVLRRVADCMRSRSNPEDTLARVGGDEFVILCEEGVQIEAAKAMAHAILGDILEPVMFEGKQCVVGASFGIASTEPLGLGHGELLNAADKALYAVKHAGRAAVAVYDGDMHTEAVRERSLSDRIRYALRDHEVVPFFQTQHYADTGEIFGVEVLARWNHPEFGVLTPDTFLGVVRQMGLEAELDSAVFAQAVQISDRLIAQGYPIPRVAFNVSAARINDPNFVQDVCQTIPRQRHRFGFEILESVYYEETSSSLKMTIDTLRELGFQFDVDDFGSQHASINSVLNIWPDALKIDRNIIKPIVESQQALRMTMSIVDLARALDMKVIAEGVDSEKKVRLLKKIGCDVLQGFHFSKPMSAHEFEQFLDVSNGSRTIAS
ncbi:MAG: bifunctional diguanylate cyclase/phosphodiesterase [Pseudomonadota bacterium]